MPSVPGPGEACARGLLGGATVIFQNFKFVFVA